MWTTTEIITPILFILGIIAAVRYHKKRRESIPKFGFKSAMPAGPHPSFQYLEDRLLRYLVASSNSEALWTYRSITFFVVKDPHIKDKPVVALADRLTKTIYIREASLTPNRAGMGVFLHEFAHIHFNTGDETVARKWAGEILNKMIEAGLI